MDEKTKEDIAIAIVTGIIASIVTFFSRRVIRKIQERI